MEGHMIILTTARPESMRDTYIQLNLIPIIYLMITDKIDYGYRKRPRYLINDLSPKEPGERAYAINLVKRDEGI